MFEFGKYAGAVIGSYASFLVLILGFLYVSVSARKKARAALDKLESET